MAGAELSKQPFDSKFWAITQQNFYFVAFGADHKKEARQYGVAAGLPYFCALYAVYGTDVYARVVSSTEGVPGSARAKPRGNTQNRYWASVAAAGGLRAARITGSPVSMLRMCRI